MQHSASTPSISTANLHASSLPLPTTTAPAPMPSDSLLQGRKAIEISHNGSVYRLQATKLGKLILTK